MSRWKSFAILGVSSIAWFVSTSGVRSEDPAKANVYWGSETAEANELNRQYSTKKGTMGKSQHAMVAACHNRSSDIGVEILKRGGHAVDAFIAATFADYVQTPGCSSLGGPMGALVYDANGGKIKSLMAPLKTVQSQTGQWRAGEKAIGLQVLVPGAASGLQALHKRHGRLPWSDLITPAARLRAKVLSSMPCIRASFVRTLKRSNARHMVGPRIFTKTARRFRSERY